MSATSKPADHFRYVGIDGAGIKRVFGTGPTADVAETECREAMIEYVARRRDTGPLAKWRVEKA